VPTLFSVPSFSLLCGGTITVTNFASGNVDDVLILPGSFIIDGDGTFAIDPGNYTAVGRVAGVAVTDPVPFTIAVCPSTGPTPSPVVITPPTSTAPPTDVAGGVVNDTSIPVLPVMLLLAAIAGGALFLTRKHTA